MIRAIRNFIQKTGLIYVAVLLLLITSCGKEAVLAKSINNLYSGETLYRAIFFAQGDLGKAIPANAHAIEIYESISKDKKDEVEFLVEETIANINEIDEDFFDKFASLVLSEDFNDIEKGVKYGSDMTFTALLRSEKYAYMVQNAQKVLDETDFSQYDFTKASDLARLRQDVLRNFPPEDNPKMCTLGFGFCITTFLILWWYFAGGVAIVIYIDAVAGIHTVIEPITRVGTGKINEKYIAELYTTFNP